MSGANSFGKHLILTSFGESHGPAMGAVIDGCPAGLNWDQRLLETELARRRPGSSNLVSARSELDRPEVLSGIYQEKTLGTPIAVVVKNTDARPNDYSDISKAPRPGHADDIWRSKFGHTDPRGGGRSSGRETLCRVIGGAVAKMILSRAAPRLQITGFARAIGPLKLSDTEWNEFKISCDEVKPGFDIYHADRFAARFPSAARQDEVETLLTTAKTNGLSYGGVAELRVSGMIANLGQPVFHKLKADLASAMLSVGATTSFEIGAGIEATQAEGSVFHRQTNESHYGGIRGGISSGEDLIFRVGFKPTSTVLDAAKKGRHDPCIVPRAIPVLEAMTALVLADHWLAARLSRI
jgi:chorismate synthase